MNQFVTDRGGSYGLRHFRQESLSEFLEFECGVNQYDIPSDEASKSERLFHVLANAQPAQQATILTRLLSHIPEGEFDDDATRQVRQQVVVLVERLQKGMPAIPVPKVEAGQQVKSFLAEAATLLPTHGAQSVLDRIHGGLVAHLRDVLRRNSIPFPNDTGLPKLVRILMEQHPAYRELQEQGEPHRRLIGGFAAALEGLNELRNNWSQAHPNEPLDPRVAHTALDVAGTIFQDMDRFLAPGPIAKSG